jgi:hypothetical protein
MPVYYSENRLLLASRNGKARNARRLTRHGWNLENETENEKCAAKTLNFGR